MAYGTLLTPLGTLTLFEEAGALVALEWGSAGCSDTAFGDRRPEGPPPLAPAEDGCNALLHAALRHLDRYFDGVPLPADVPLRPAGTPYQRAVWQAIAAIPFAATRSYAELAHAVGSGPRAVARACASNPLPLFIPCHRVVGSGGRLGGYSTGEGIATKQALLALEAVAWQEGR